MLGTPFLDELGKAFLGCGLGRRGVDRADGLAIWSQYLRVAEVLRSRWITQVWTTARDHTVLIASGSPLSPS